MYFVKFHLIRTDPFTYQKRTYAFGRLPITDDKNLRAWSAAEELILQFIAEKKPSHLGIYQDRFGFLTCLASADNKHVVTYLASQRKAIISNRSDHQIEDPIHFYNPLESIPESIDMVVMRMPKSLDLFRLYLHQLSDSIHTDGEVIVGFMTRHFTKKMVNIADLYFSEHEQTQSYKKSRLLILRSPKPKPPLSLTNNIVYKDFSYHQYLGIFSADKVDLATQFFLQNINLLPTEKTILDWGCGNGIIGHQLLFQMGDGILHLMDDADLAILSAKLNLSDKNVHFHHDYNLSVFEELSLDLIVSNPPFHYEHEQDISIAIRFFREAHRCLKSGARLLIVANQHLNYRTHLHRLFSKVRIINENKRFQVMEGFK